MNIQIIQKAGKPEWAVVPYREYENLIKQSKILEDIRDYDLAKKALSQGEELIPSAVTYAILDGGNPIKVWRQYRKINQQLLAKTVAISKAYLSQLESGARKGTTQVLKKIAKALDVSLDDL